MPLTRIKLTAFADGGISTAKLSNTLDLSTKTVTLPDNSVTTSKISNDAVTVPKLADVLDLTSNTITLPQGVGGTNWNNTIITPSNVGSATIAANNGYYIDTTNGSVTINLPTSPSRGDYICFVDYAGTLSDTVSSGVHSNRIRLNPGSNKLKGEIAIKDIASPRGAVSVVYTDSALGASGTQGWVVMESANETTTKSLVTSAPTITSVLNSLNLGYFQDSTTAVMTITGTNFLSNTSVVLVPSDSSGDLTPTKTFVNSTSITFTVTTAIINKAKTGSFDDRFDIKVANPDGSYAIASDALEYAPAPTFSTATALNTSAQPITTNSNNPLRDTFAELNTASTVVATSLDADDVITYSLVSNDAGINGIAVASNGAISGTPSASPIVSGTYNLVVRATATSNETSQTKTTDKTFEVIMEAEVAAPTVSSVSQTFIANSGTEITVTGTGFTGTTSTTFGGTVQLIDPSGTAYTATNGNLDSSTQLKFTTTTAIRDAIAATGASPGDERYDIKVTNPAGAGSYGKDGTLENAFEWLPAPLFVVSTGNVGTLQPAASQDYSTLTGLSSGKLDATIQDPDDTNLTFSLTSVASELSNLAINSGTGAITGTADLSSVSAGTYNFTVQASVVSAETGATKSDSVQYSVTIASASSGPGYTSNIQNSLHFDGSSYLSKSFSGSNRKTMTFSVWSKQGALSVSSQIFSSGGSVSDQIFFGDTDIFRIYLSGGYRIETTSVFRDTSAWNHFVISIDTTNSYVRLYQNGAEIATGSISAGTDIKLNDAGTHYIGRYAASSADHFNGYMANIHFIDGHALNPNYFGKTDTATGAWIAKAYDGTTNETGTPSSSSDYDTLYGTNGFLLDFRASSLVYSGSTLSTINDVSGRTTPNNWTAN
tara:strand:- start:4282 stop:6942 length:2661 start_codon:yes stop_codon:yes gene_type:complete